MKKNSYQIGKLRFLDYKQQLTSIFYGIKKKKDTNTKQK